MIKKLSFFLFCLIFIFCISVTASSHKSFLWKINTGAKPSYILGSLHLARSDLYPLANTIENAFNDSDILVVEINILNKDPLAIQQQFMEKGIYPYGRNLRDSISNKTLELLKDKLKDLGMTIEQVNNMKPWYLAMNLVTFDLLRLGFNPVYGIDMYFMQRSQGTKEIDELETFAYQLNLFNNLSAREQELFLLSTLIDLDVIEQEIDNIVSAWKTGDTRKMQSILQEGLQKYPELAPFYDKVIYKRNKEMAEKIEKMLQNGKSFFFIIGGAHLVGREGIIQLLKEKGYSLEQL